MAVSLAACGGQAATEESSAPTEQTETAEPTTEETTQPEESSAPAEDEPVEIKPSFDTGWASNAFEKLIPQPPFEGWNGEKISENAYKMETSQANADGSDTYYDTWAAYVQTLRDCGFTVQGDTYSAEGTDRNGNQVELQCGDGHAWITIYKAKTDHTAATPTDSESIRLSDDRKSVLSWLPAEDWEIFDNDRETILNAYDKEESFRIECTTAIAANGDTLTESGTAPDGTYYEKYENNNGCRIGVLFQSANGYVGLETIW